ncbi:MAG: hypothetical protein J0H74_27680, partial [Chitinophagaceae bacterium]|nr:hypothetical protein [Chitinophagaceae bacterium]
PGEIGNVLLESGLVRQAVVVARGDARGMLRLVGYVVPEGVLDKGGLVEYLKGRLPAYMVPVVWVELEELPLNSNGKVDKRRLPDVGDEPREGYEAPRTEMEGLLAGIWGEVLGVDRVGVRDNFFDLGGNSLVMLPLLSKIRGVSERVSLKDLFVYQTIERLAAWMDKNAGGGSRRETGLVSGGHLISLHEGDSSATLFIVPGSQGFSDGYDELAKAFGDRHAVYGIQMMGSREGEEPIRDIPEIAKQNIRWIKTVQPDGPYRFVAHCFGAHVAYEMTRQLESGGEEVAFTALLDISVDLDRLGITGTVIPLECMMTTLRRLLYAFGFMEDWGDEGLAWMGEFSARLEAIPEDDRPAVIGRCLRDRYPQRQEMVDFIMRLFNLEMTNILVNYVPSGRIVSPLVIVRAEEEDWHGYGESLGWHAFSDKCHVMTAPGTHDSMVRSAHAIVLVQRLLKIIEEFVIRSEGF